MDSFAYGKTPRQGRGLGRATRYLVFGVVVVGLGYGVFTATKTGGGPVVTEPKHVTKQISAASDVRAQANLRTALSAATTVFVDGGSFASASGTQLAVLEPSFRYVDGSHLSTGPNVISVVATRQAWGGAVLSDSGVCFYIRSVGTTQAYGSGDVCTGEAAMGATRSSF